MEYQIAIVEDQDSIRNNLIELFELYNFQTLSCRDVAEASDKIRKYIPHVIICDVMLPDGNGFDLIETLRKEPHLLHIPVIFLTAKTSPEDKMKGLETGAIDYITKPFSTRELIQKVNNLTGILNQQVKKALSSPVDKSYESADQIFLKKLQQIIELNIQDHDLDVETVAKALHLSASSIHKKIKAIAGKSTNQFIREYRLEHAKKMLESQHASVSEIAFKSGFNSLSYFSRSYKEYFGMPPKGKRSQQ